MIVYLLIRVRLRLIVHIQVLSLVRLMQWQCDDEDQGSVRTSTCLLLKVLRLIPVWNAGLGQSYAEKSRAPLLKYVRYV